jgi:hypothetical protein
MHVRKFDLAEENFEWLYKDLVEQGMRFVLARTPINSPPDFKTGRSTTLARYTLPPLGLSLSCLLRVWIYANGKVMT